jgi:hypothetical protein
MRQQKEEAGEVWREIEAAPDYQLFRQRLLSRQQALAHQRAAPQP